MKYNKMISFRLNEQDRDTLKKIMVLEKVSRSDLIRLLIREGAAKRGMLAGTVNKIDRENNDQLH